MTSTEQLKWLSKKLNLAFETQDWGIINSSPERLLEFIQFFEKETSPGEWSRYEMFELVMASYSDALEDDKCTDALKVEFNAWFNRNKDDVDLVPAVAYWKKYLNFE